MKGGTTTSCKLLHLFSEPVANPETLVKHYLFFQKVINTCEFLTPGHNSPKQSCC